MTLKEINFNPPGPNYVQSMYFDSGDLVLISQTSQMRIDTVPLKILFALHEGIEK